MFICLFFSPTTTATTGDSAVGRRSALPDDAGGPADHVAGRGGASERPGHPAGAVERHLRLHHHRLPPRAAQGQRLHGGSGYDVRGGSDALPVHGAAGRVRVRDVRDGAGGGGAADGEGLRGDGHRQRHDQHRRPR